MAFPQFSPATREASGSDGLQDLADAPENHQSWQLPWSQQQMAEKLDWGELQKGRQSTKALIAGTFFMATMEVLHGAPRQRGGGF